jgi:hypothetical protein
MWHKVTKTRSGKILGVWTWRNWVKTGILYKIKSLSNHETNSLNLSASSLWIIAYCFWVINHPGCLLFIVNSFKSSSRTREPTSIFSTVILFCYLSNHSCGWILSKKKKTIELGKDYHWTSYYSLPSKHRLINLLWAPKINSFPR